MDSPLRKSSSEGRDLPREDGELSSDVHAGEIVSRIRFRVSEGFGGVDDGREGRFGGDGGGRGVVVEDVGNWEGATTTKRRKGKEGGQLVGQRRRTKSACHR